MTIAIIINDAPYGNEKAYNALRLAMILQRKPAHQVRVFLTGGRVVFGQTRFRLGSVPPVRATPGTRKKAESPAGSPSA